MEHLCRCACVQDFADWEAYEQQRFEAETFTKHTMTVHSSLPFLPRNY